MLLSIDSSAVTASAALTDGDTVIKSEFVKSGLTHSETLLPMIQRVMEGVDAKALDAIAVTHGPGSFTGVRIGVATVKGIAFTNKTPCIPVSTLEAIAYNFADSPGAFTVCAVMDARRMQFYNALFSVNNGVITRLTPDRAIALEALREELASFDKVIVAGDGAELCSAHLALAHCTLAPEAQRYQNAVAIAKAAKTKEPIPPEALMPYYLRQSQAERELKLKKAGG